jgi:hypothetical protein
LQDYVNLYPDSVIFNLSTDAFDGFTLEEALDTGRVNVEVSDAWDV